MLNPHRVLVLPASLVLFAIACGLPPIDLSLDTDTGGDPPPATTGTIPDDSGPGSSISATSASTTTPPDPTATSDESGDSGESDGSTGMVVSCDPSVIDLGDGVPVDVMGDTTNEDNDHKPSCFPQCAADAAYTWTAPAAGIYTITTQGSFYDTGLYVLDGACAGKEIACNDDAFGLQSAVVVTLAAGQTITIIVDGYAYSEGPFSLHIIAGQPFECINWYDCKDGWCDNGVCVPWGGDTDDWGDSGWSATATSGWAGTGVYDTGWYEDDGPISTFGPDTGSYEGGGFISATSGYDSGWSDTEWSATSFGTGWYDSGGYDTGWGEDGGEFCNWNSFDDGADSGWSDEEG